MLFRSVSESNFKSYDELKSRLNKVLGLSPVTMPTRDESPFVEDSPAPAKEAPAPKVKAASTDNDDQDLDDLDLDALLKDLDD